MPRLAWLTDIHLNFLKKEPSQLTRFFASVRATRADAVLIGGDIGEAHDVVDFLCRIDDELAQSVYFVLGNHDFYFGSIKRVRDQVTRLCHERPRLHYLTAEGVHEIAPSVGLVGHDGWADARVGDYDRSTVMLNDYQLIEELARITKAERRVLLGHLGDQAAAHIREVLPAALRQYHHVILLTHPPPMEGACWHEGAISADDWTPHFTCQAMGDACMEVMRNHADRQLTVLCGHTHGQGEYRPLPSLIVLTGGAEYGSPEVQRVFEF
jgi:3',5'-cyclic-AMP phosphodiesterase